MTRKALRMKLHKANNNTCWEGSQSMEGGDEEGSSRPWEEEALLLKSLSETSYKSGDIPSALNYALRALQTFPSLPGIRPLLSSLRILGHSHPDSPTLSPPDYYGILQVEPFSDVEAVRRKYKSLALALHPDKNPSFVCQDAFKVVGDALRVLSDAGEKERYDLGLRVRMQEDGLGRQGGDGGLGVEARFWSRCRECGKFHEFEKGFSGKRLVCSGCGKSFKAVGVGEEAGDGMCSENEATDEDVGIVAVAEGSKETIGSDRAVRGGDIIYVRKRKGGANRVEEIDAIRKPTSDSGGGYAKGMGIRTKKVRRGGKDVSGGCGEGAERGFEMDDDEEEFWDLKLKDGLSKGMKAEALGGSLSKSEVSVEVDEPTKYGEKHKVRSRDARRELKSRKKHALTDVEEKKTVVVIGLRCMTDEDGSKIAQLSTKVHSEKHQSPEVDMGGGSGEWGGSRRRSLRVQVQSAGELAQISDEEDDASAEEVITLAEMQSRLIQKVSCVKEKTNNKEKRTEKENEREKLGAKQVGVEAENVHERVMKQVMEDKEEQQRNNHRDVDGGNEFGKDCEKEMEKSREMEESVWQMDEERDVEIEKMNDEEEEDDQQKELKNQEREKEEVGDVANNTSVNGKDNGEQEANVTGIQRSNQDETSDNGTWGNGDVVEETAADTRWVKRIRCYETKRRALLKRSKELGVEILETSSPADMRSSLAMESPTLTKSRNPRHLNSSNSDFYDFSKDRGERNFKKGQVWAVYDEFGQPRRYVLIDEVRSTNPFAVRLKGLAKQETKAQDPAQSCAGCGRFKVTNSAIVKSVGIFSHEVNAERVAREMYDIYPKKGSVWAIYGGTQRHECYDIVVCLTSYIEMFGLSLAYLEKMGGFRTVYKRKDIGWDAVRWLGKGEIVLLSHQIPARRLSHDDVFDFKEDCWVLDPVSISPPALVDGVGKSC